MNSRILHVPRRFVADEWGGTETVIVEISRFQQQQGWRPEVFTSLALSDVNHELIGGIPVRRFNYCYPFLGLGRDEKRLLDKKGGNLLSLPLFFALLSTPDVRLFHAHALNRLGGEVRTAARLRRKPYLVSLHGGYFDLPATEADLMQAPVSGKLEWGKAFGALFGSRRVLDDADHVICVGESEYHLARTRIGHDRISHLPNGVDPEKFKHGDGSLFRKKHGIPSQAFLIANISRIDPQKNQLLLLEAFAKLRCDRPESHLLLIGPETQAEYARKLRTFIEENRLSPSVTWLPGIANDDPDLVNAYHACDVFALSSVHEPFGIVVLEAWSSGKPVVVSRVGGLKTLVREDETGLFIEPVAGGAAQALAAKLNLLATRPEWRGKIGAAGLHEVALHYTWEVIGKKLEQIYQSAESHNALSRGG